MPVSTLDEQPDAGTPLINPWLDKIKHTGWLALLLFGELQAATFTVAGNVVSDLPLASIIVYLQPQQPLAAPPRAHQISQQGREFHPGLQVIQVGDQVDWLNDERRDIDHNIYSLNPVHSFDLGLGPRNSRLSQQFNRTGSLTYFCSVHKNMEGKLVILPSRHFTQVAAPGRFTITDVPAGDWQLNAVVLHRRYKVIPTPLRIEGDLDDLTLRVVKR